MTDAADVAGTDTGRPADRAWPTPIFQTNILVPIAIAIGSLLAGAVYTWFVGEDVNWDWQNYHEYNVWAVLTDRYGIDALPPGFQTYFNPTVYFPVYYLRHLLPLPYGLMIIGAVHGLNLLLIYFLIRVLLREAATTSAIGASILIAAVGPMTLSEVGTSFSDILTALPVIAGCILILSADGSRPGRYALAGLLIGAAVGLKLTNAVYALGAAAAVLAAGRPLLATLCLGLGGATGALVTGGAWGLMLWREMGNPIFPLFNAVFQSPEVMPMNIMDWQFLPKGYLDALAYPFYWLIGDNRSSEYPFRDARFAVAMLLILAGIGRTIVSRVAIVTQRDVQFLLFFIVSYAAWLAVFSIQRYAVVLELLCAPLIVLLMVRCFASPSASSAGALSLRMNGAIAATALLIALWSQPGDWFRRPWSNPYNPVIPRELQQAADYLVIDKPLAYIAPRLPSQSRFFQLADIGVPVMPGGVFDRRIRTALKSPLPGGIWELHTRGKPAREHLLERYGVRVDTSRPCVEIEGAWLGTEIEACPLAARDK